MIKRGMTVMLHNGDLADLIGPNNGDGWLARVHSIIPHVRRLQRDDIAYVRVSKPISAASTGSWRKP